MSAALHCKKEEKCDTSQFVLFYRCIIVMGLDKKLCTPKRKIEYREERHVCSWEHAVHSEPSNSSVEQNSSKNSELVILPGYEASMETVEETLETGEEYRREEMKNQSSQESKDSQEDISKNGIVFPNMSRGWEMGEDDSGEGMGLRASSFDWGMRNVVMSVSGQ